MRATYSPLTRGTHHIFRRQGLSAFSARRRRTVSRETCSCSVNRTISPASNASVQRARPSGGLEQAVATSRASSLPESLRAAPGRGPSSSARSKLTRCAGFRAGRWLRVPRGRRPVPRDGTVEARDGHGPGDPDRRRVLLRGRLRPRPLPRSQAAPARPDAGARGQRGADGRDRRRVPRPRHGPGPARLLPAPLRPPVPAFAGGPPHHLRPAGGQPVGGQARALAAARRDGGTRSRGDARRQHAGAGLPLRPRPPLPRLPRPRRVRARPRGAPDLLRPAAPPAHRLAGGDHGRGPGAGERGRPGGRAPAPRRSRGVGARRQGLLEPGHARRTRRRRAPPDRAAAGQGRRDEAVAGAAGADAAPDRDRAEPARRTLPRQAGPGAGRVAPHRPLAAQARQPHPGRPALPAGRPRATRLRTAARDLKPAHRLNYTNDSVFQGNVVRGGEKCVFIYNANKNRFAGNRFADCDVGIHFTAGSERNVISGNAFIGNRNQVKYVGTRYVDWSDKGRGNYWSDDPAFDLDGDGIADQPYRPNDLVDRIVWAYPTAKLLLNSPAVQVLRAAQA